MRIVIGLVLLGIVGCGGEMPTPEPTGGTTTSPPPAQNTQNPQNQTTALQGTWGAQVGDCFLGWVFDDTTWAREYLCKLPDGSIGIEIFGGTYTAGSSALSMTLVKASCADATAGKFSEAFSFVGKSLRLVDSAGVAILDRLPAPMGGSTASAEFGCYDDHGLFTAHPIAVVGN